LLSNWETVYIIGRQPTIIEFMKKKCMWEEVEGIAQIKRDGAKFDLLNRIKR
jgi:hypothetical protein